MRKRRDPSGERKDRIMTLLEYIDSNPGCRRLNIDAYINVLYKSSLRPGYRYEYRAPSVTSIWGRYSYGIVRVVQTS